MRDVALAWAEEGREVGVAGSGSNLLVADEGVGGPAVELEGDLIKIVVDETSGMILCGGGARVPAIGASGAGAAGVAVGARAGGSAA